MFLHASAVLLYSPFALQPTAYLLHSRRSVGNCELTRLFLKYFFLCYQEAAPPGAEEDEVAQVNRAGAARSPSSTTLFQWKKKVQQQAAGWQLD